MKNAERNPDAHQDAFGKPLEIGDRVVILGTGSPGFSHGSVLQGKIIGYTPKGLRVEYFQGEDRKVDEGTPGAKWRDMPWLGPGKGSWYKKGWRKDVLVRWSGDIIKEIPQEDPV